MRANLQRLHAVLLVGFAIVALALGYWQMFRQNEVLARSTNPRLAEAERRVVRGKILDRNGTVLAQSVLAGDAVERQYAGAWVANVVGYHSLRYGDGGIEARYDDYLRGSRSADPFDRLTSTLLHRPTVGSDVVLTIDARIQQAATEALGASPGAIVALDPRTGAVLALASTPTFDPNSLDDDWPRLAQSAGQPLFNRATQSAYTPGSTFKLITAAAAIDLNLVDVNATYRCTTPIGIGQLTIDCRNHSQLPSVTYREAFAWSCNRTFGLTGLELGTSKLVLGDDQPSPPTWEGRVVQSAARLEEYSQRFQFGRQIPFDLPVRVSQVKGPGEWYPSLLAQTGFGQGEIEATPLLMALAAATVANGGVVPAPYLVTEVRAPTGAVATINAGGGSLGRATQPATAATLNEMMVLSVDTAYAHPAAIPGIKVGGKTGTAEAGPAGATPHSWFIGYAPADNPRVAVAVIMEHRGSGTDFATPAGQIVMRRALEVYRPADR
ncbi:MAG: penicillin-binding protein 2 [Chloroflexi bacterium]|nr:penicillin-binding protein 2 [Chloroflexota bacterium]